MPVLFLVLASWFRLKYPHVAMGAVASSAPILQFDDITPWSSFYDAVSQDFKVTMEISHYYCNNIIVLFFSFISSKISWSKEFRDGSRMAQCHLSNYWS